jgi:hypothetical protein
MTDERIQIPPDFVIAGGPRCATTALYTALKQHPRLWMSPIKEPHYYAGSLAGGRAIATAADYRQLFDAAPLDRLRGEASVLYLSVPDAIPALLLDRPDAKIIAMVRNPIDVFLSWHNHCFNWLDENQPDVERA